MDIFSIFLDLGTIGVIHDFRRVGGPALDLSTVVLILLSIIALLMLMFKFAKPRQERSNSKLMRLLDAYPIIPAFVIIALILANAIFSGS